MDTNANKKKPLEAWTQDPDDEQTSNSDKVPEGVANSDITDGLDVDFDDPAFRYVEPALHHPQGSLTSGQPIYVPAFGHCGFVKAIDGDNVTYRVVVQINLGSFTFRVEDSEGKVHECTINRADVVTLHQAEAEYLSGEERRLSEGKTLLIIKKLCLLMGRGVWTGWYTKHKYARSTADDKIRRYGESVTEAAREAQTPGNRADDDEKWINPDRKDNPRADDPEEGERKATTEGEITKRDGRKTTDHATDWTIRIKKLPTDVLKHCREKYKKAGSRDWWRRAAYQFAGVDPDTAPAATTESTLVATPKEVSEIGASQVTSTPPADDDVAEEARSILRSFKRYPAAAIDKLKFPAGLDVTGLVRDGLKQFNGRKGVTHVDAKSTIGGMPHQ